MSSKRNLKRIRKTYGVPARKGRWFRYDGVTYRILGGYGLSLHVQEVFGLKMRRYMYVDWDAVRWIDNKRAEKLRYYTQRISELKTVDTSSGAYARTEHLINGQISKFVQLIERLSDD